MTNQTSHWLQSELTCQDVMLRASEYLDDRLPMVAKVPVKLHLASCPVCRAYVKQIALVAEAVALLPKLYPSPTDRLRLRQHFARCHAPAQ